MASESISKTPHYVRKYPGATLLSLDGGGVKGISSLLILQKIMDRVKEIENRELDRERLPKDYFDLAGGTSTGGLAVLMLFRLGMSTSSCIRQYRELSAKVFAPTIKGYEIHKLPFGYSFGNFWLWVKRFRQASAFSAPRLESAIEKVLRDPQRGKFQCTGDTPLRDESGKSGRM
jgi:patatin-like phospholipase/acyl hydrolase